MLHVIAGPVEVLPDLAGVPLLDGARHLQDKVRQEEAIPSRAGGCSHEQAGITAVSVLFPNGGN